ncbi:hypothetical protein [Tenacibaculum maritimum]|uniref:hypothetical protein n=2 Tax=Tenacibaculum maritimum TaxID=107401 RepID=UPI001E5A3CBC|nr:hypothetical protein [Tenacibaculum maritimum]MCD9580841.1 hypothetical protein [Tenacibaculum maritimum]MCD9635115.1 hypothetical protein [Tenacibaculum maritimum]
MASIYLMGQDTALFKLINSKHKNMNIETKTGKIQPVKLISPDSNEEFQVSVSDNYTIIRLNNREWYFNLDGSFDGTGTNCGKTIIPN